MGITGLWPLLGEGEVVAIVQLAADHFKRHGRPIRIAVDEAGWRFNNVTEAQTKAIQNSSANAAFSHPIEKSILYFTTQLLRQNVKLLFVFDGPKRPWKRGRHGGNQVDWKRIALTRDMLRHLQVPYHMAPGEAEAECAMLQQMGVVDAVWSDDGDTLMFGCDFLIRSHRMGGKSVGPKSKTHVRVWRTTDICRKPEMRYMDRHGLLLFALLVGADYDKDGISGCGPQKALRAVQHGLGQQLSQLSPGNNDILLQRWRSELASVLKCSVPASFPNQKAWKNYKFPAVTTDQKKVEELDHRFQRNNLPDERQLQHFALYNFNFDLKAYLKHLSPVHLIRALRGDFKDLQVSSSLGLEVKIPRLASNSSIDDRQPPSEYQICYNPHALALTIARGQLQIEAWPDDFHTKTSETSIPRHVLEIGAPEAIRVADEKWAAKTGKRKRQENDDDCAQPKRGRKGRKPNTTAVATDLAIYEDNPTGTVLVNAIEVDKTAKLKSRTTPKGMHHEQICVSRPALAQSVRVAKQSLRMPQVLVKPAMLDGSGSAWDSPLDLTGD